MGIRLGAYVSHSLLAIPYRLQGRLWRRQLYGDVNYYPIKQKQHQLRQRTISQWGTSPLNQTAVTGFHLKICRCDIPTNTLHMQILWCFQIGKRDVMGTIARAFYSPDPYTLAIWLGGRELSPNRTQLNWYFADTK